MSILLSIKPKYANAIFKGDKKFEFRKKLFKKKDVRRVYVYSSSPVKKIIGYFEIKDILSATPAKLWHNCQQQAGITKGDFFDYFKDLDSGYALVVGNVYEFVHPLDPKGYIINFTPPQSFCYVENSFESLILNKYSF